MTEPTTSPMPPLDTLVSGSGPGLVLAHGAGGGIQANFGPMLPELCAHHTVVGPDYPGSGLTPMPDDGTLDLDELADAVVGAGVDAGLESFAMLGISLGSAVSVRAAVRHPGRVRALVLTAGFAKPDALFDLRLRVWRDLAATGDREALQRFLMLVVSRDDAFASTDPEDLAELVGQAARQIPPGSEAHRELVGKVDIRADLVNVRAPTLVLAPTRDALVHPRQSRELADNIPGARLEELDANHILTDPSPRDWLQRTLEFLASRFEEPVE